MRRTGKHKRRAPKSASSLAPPIADPLASTGSSPQLAAAGEALRADAASGPSLLVDAPPPPAPALGLVDEEPRVAPPPAPSRSPDREVAPRRANATANANAKRSRLVPIAIVLGILLYAFAFVRVGELPPSDAEAVTQARARAGRVAVAVAPLRPAPVSVAGDPGPPPVALTSGSALDPAAAAGERWEAQAALDIGDLRRAANVAGWAVVHDPSDADGWLLLAAAEIEIGNESAARRALLDCRERATHGPRGECAAVLQSR